MAKTQPTVHEYRFTGESERVFPHIQVVGGGVLKAVPNAVYNLGPNIVHPLLEPVTPETSEQPKDV